MVELETLINVELNTPLVAGQGLLVVDENIDPKKLTFHEDWLALTNRFDQANDLSRAGWAVEFNDFHWPNDHDVHRVVIRIPKEKAIVHHLINLAGEHLTPGDSVVLVGGKSEGIKSIAKHAQAYLYGGREDQKIGNDLWRIELTRGHSLSQPLNDHNYTTLVAVTTIGEHSLISKPGVYGWKKIDKGSQLLIERLPEMLGNPLPLGGIRVLDLGCGSGYLSLASCSASTDIVATDNNCAALLATQATLNTAGLRARVVASNAGDELDSAFDLIVCNPPFHSGFGIDYDLTDRFAKNSAARLTDTGCACFVVNQHVPLKRIASNYFHDVILDTDTGNFCTYKLQRPKR